MTLFKQLFWGTSIAFLVILGATEAVYIRNAHKYLQEQLASHAQDAATSLGLVLPTALADGDMIRAEVTVNAVFDRGYYQSIRVLNINGDTIVLKNLPTAPAEVPQWFVNVLPLDTPSAESLISKGWRQLGRVVVSSHPNFAYKQLWSTLVEATLGLFILYLVALLALRRFLIRILRPIHDIEVVAHAISMRDFQLVKVTPRTRELRSVVNAINSMSNKLRGIIDHEVQQAIRFRDESIKDVLTGLDNRRGFEAYVETILDERIDIVSVAMFMLQIADFQGYNSRHGFREGDTLLKDISDVLKSIWTQSEILRSRLNGATFVLVIPNLTQERAEVFARKLMLAVGEVVDRSGDEIPISFGCGAILFGGQSATVKSMLAQCDMAMLQSLSH